jgi:hypothetical protein
VSHDNDSEGLLPLFRTLSPEGRARLNWFKHTWLYLDRYTRWAIDSGRHPGKGVGVIAWHGGVSVSTARRRLRKMLAAGVVRYSREHGWSASQTKKAREWAEDCE